LPLKFGIRNTTKDYTNVFCYVYLSMKRPTGFWNDIKQPIHALAPMADVTDAAFRLLIARHGKPDVLFTEFVSCDGLCSPGRKNLMHILKYDESERPIVCQFFGANPAKYYESALLAQELGFDGIDINMGCPERKILKQGSGGALIKTPVLAREIIRETKRGAGSLPVSVKTRIGVNQMNTEEWVSHILEEEPACLTLHLRTVKEMSRTAPHWDQAEITARLAENSNTLILGNGDIKNLTVADEMAKQTGLDGIMFGRAIFGNPWLFNSNTNYDEVSLNQKLEAALEHADLYEELFGKQKNFLIMRKHLREYPTGFVGAKELRAQLQMVDSAADVHRIVAEFRSRTTASI